MRRHRRDLETISEMNLTNLIDTAFILVITFLLIAPSIKHGIDIQMPEVAATSLDTGPHTLTIVIGKRPMADMEEPIYIEDRRVDLDQMAQTASDKKALYPKLDILIEADKDATCDTYAKVLAKLTLLGFESVGFETEIPQGAAEVKPKPRSSGRRAQ